MKFQVAFLLSTIATTASYTSAEVCTDAQKITIEGETDTAFKTACPVFFTNSSSSALNLNPTTTIDAFNEIDSCKMTACTSFLTNITVRTPDCELESVNAKGVYSTLTTLCKQLATGSITDEQLSKIYDDLLKNTGKALEDGSSNAEEEVVAGNATASVPTAAPPASNSSTTAPASTKSSAITYFTSVAAIATATVVSALAL